MKKVNLDVLKPWITARVNDYLSFEDDVLVEFIFSQLEDKVFFYDFSVLFSIQIKKGSL